MHSGFQSVGWEVSFLESLFITYLPSQVMLGVSQK